jgi:hypothetical protein
LFSQNQVCLVIIGGIDCEENDMAKKPSNSGTSRVELNSQEPDPNIELAVKPLPAKESVPKPKKD